MIQDLEPQTKDGPPPTLTRSRIAERAYRENMTVGGTEEELLERYAPLVFKTIQRYCPVFPPDTDLGDWVNIGLLALLQSSRTFESKRGVSFVHFARTCIKNSIFDEFRRRSPLTRSSYRLRQRIESAIQDLMQKLQRDPEEHEIAAHLGLGLAEYHQSLEEIQAVVFESISEPSKLSTDEGADFDIPDLTQQSPDEQLVGSDHRKLVRERLHRLPDAQKKVVTLFYYEGLRFKDIAELLGVTAARVSQLHTQAVCFLRVEVLKVC